MAMQAKSTRKPKFLRQEWFRQGNVRKKWLKWRRARGGQSKLRTHIKGKGFMPHPGYGMPAAWRGLHPSGLKEVTVHNTGELKLLDAKTCAARIAGCVGNRKRLEMQAEAEKMGMRVLNPRKIEIRAKKTEAKPAEKNEAMKK